MVEVYVSYLRKKLDVHGPPLIRTVRGIGYSMRTQPVPDRGAHAPPSAPEAPAAAAVPAAPAPGSATGGGR